MKAYIAVNEPGTLEYSWAKKTPGPGETEEDVKGVYLLWQRFKDMEALQKCVFVFAVS